MRFKIFLLTEGALNWIYKYSQFSSWTFFFFFLRDPASEENLEGL